MVEMDELTKVAVVQAAPVVFDRDKTVDKTCRLIKEAAGNGSQLILFPEAFIPAYPRGLSFGMLVGGRTDQGRHLWQRYWENAIAVPGPETDYLGKTIKEYGVHVAIGVIERDSTYTKGTLFCTLLYFGKDGKLMGKHRKLKPTGSERLIWGEGDGSTLFTMDSEIGRIGGLICWENYMPLARMAMYAKGIDIYLAPTADHREIWQCTMRHVALEGRCFVLSCNQFMTKSMYPEDIRRLEDLKDQPEVLCRGGSVVISPLGRVIAGPVWDREEILYAKLDRGEIARGKVDFDVTGHYARPDVFRLQVNESPLPPVSSGPESTSSR